MDINSTIAQYEASFAEPKDIVTQRLHVESLFDKFVDNHSGEKISDRIAVKSNMSRNADYIFDDANIIIELKTLEGAFCGDKGFKRLRQLFIDTGINEQAFTDYIFGEAGIPEVVYYRTRTKVRRSIEKIIKKARVQIKTSIGEFGNKNTRGLILIALDELPIMSHKFMFECILSVFSNNFSDDDWVDGFIYINPNTPGQPDQAVMQYTGWFPIYRDDKVNHELSDFVNTLGTDWLNYYGKLIGDKNPIIYLDDENGIKDAFNEILR